MPPVGREPPTAAGERPQTYALNRAANGTSIYWPIVSLFSTPTVQDTIISTKKCAKIHMNASSLPLNDFLQERQQSSLVILLQPLCSVPLPYIYTTPSQEVSCVWEGICKLILNVNKLLSWHVYIALLGAAMIQCQ